MLAFYWKP